MYSSFCAYLGPSPTTNTPVAQTRNQLKNVLNTNGHLARFSEELIDSTSQHSLLAQQVAQAEAYDVVFSIPDSPGSIAEIHDFARITWLSNKIITFLNRDWNNGYANRTLIELQSTITCQVQLYDSDELPDIVIRRALDLVRRLQELQYIAGRRF